MRNRPVGLAGPPATIRSNHSIDWELVVDTTARPGRQQFTVEFHCESSSGRQFLLRGILDVKVLAGWVARPHEVVVQIDPSHKTDVRREITIYDDVADPGIAIDSIDVSNDNVIQFAVRQVRRDAPTGSHAVPYEFRPRHVVTLRISPGLSRTEWIRVRSTPKKGHALLIPIRIAMPEPDFRFVPRTLYILEERTASVSRSVEFQSRAPNELAGIVFKTSFNDPPVSIKAVSSSSRSDVLLQFELPADVPREFTIRAIRKGKVVAELPVSW